MKNLIPVVAILLASCMATPIAGPPPEIERSQRLDAVLGTWTQPSALEARALIDEYGTPDDVAAGSMSWIRKGPWDRIDVWNAPVGASETPLVQHTVGYLMAPAASGMVRQFDPRVVCDEEHRTIAARSDSEEKNTLLLNLADDVVNGRKSPGQARIAYAEIMERSYAGKTSPYLKGLLFRFGSLNP